MEEEIANFGSVLDFEGLVQGSADDKGRVKVPGPIRKYLEDTGDSTFFVTTFDRCVVRIYSREAWIRNRAKLDASTSKAAAAVLFITKVYGSAATLDKQGRILLSPALRKELEIGNEPVWFEQSKDHVEVYGKKMYDKRLEEAATDLAAKVSDVEDLGVR